MKSIVDGCERENVFHSEANWRPLLGIGNPISIPRPKWQLIESITSTFQLLAKYLPRLTYTWVNISKNKSCSQERLHCNIFQIQSLKLFKLALLWMYRGGKLSSTEENIILHWNQLPLNELLIAPVRPCFVFPGSLNVPDVERETGWAVTLFFLAANVDLLGRSKVSPDSSPNRPSCHHFVYRMMLPFKRSTIIEQPISDRKIRVLFRVRLNQWRAGWTSWYFYFVNVP